MKHYIQLFCCFLLFSKITDTAASEENGNNKANLRYKFQVNKLKCKPGYIHMMSDRKNCVKRCRDAECPEFSKCNRFTNQCTDCYSGYIFNARYRCEPICHREIKYGHCVAPDKFECFPNFIKSIDLQGNIVCDDALTFTCKILAIPALVALVIIVALLVLIILEKKKIYNIRKEGKLNGIII